MAQIPTLSDLKSYTASVDWASDEPIYIRGEFVNVAGYAETEREETMASRDMEILLDLLEREETKPRDIAEIRYIVSRPEWDAAFLMWLLHRAVVRGDVLAQTLGLAEDDD